MTKSVLYLRYHSTFELSNNVGAHKFLEALETVYKALLKGQTSFFKSNHLTALLEKNKTSDDRLIDIINYADENPKSRIAHALHILSAHKLNISSAAAIQDIHLQAFKSSHWATRTAAYRKSGNHYRYASASKSAREDRPLNPDIIIAAIKQKPLCRLSKIATIVGFIKPEDSEDTQTNSNIMGANK